MPRKIVFVHGGARENGNTRAMAAAHAAGALVGDIDATRLEFKKPCWRPPPGRWKTTWNCWSGSGKIRPTC
jgi:hypothetical protein